MIKLICIDMDGTLLNNNHQVTEENKAAIKRATEMGVKVAITTGRIFSSARYYSKILGIDTPVIASNGAYIREQDDEEIIYSNTLPSYLIVKIYEIINSHGLRVNFNTSDTLISQYEIPSSHAYKAMNGTLEEKDRVKFYVSNDIEDIVERFEGSILKGIVIEEEKMDDLKAAKEDLINKLGKELHIVSSGYNNFEIMLHSSTKGHGVEMLAQKYGIEMADVMCIGDSENDISMIEAAGVGVAMGNGLDIVKEVSNYITETNEESGVAKAIKKYII